MKTVAVINYKGGVGKTTITANIAAELAWRGEKVLLIDLDPQASLTFSFLDVEVWAENYFAKTIRNWYDAFIDYDQNLELPSLIVTPEKINQAIDSNNGGILDIICSHLSLINIDLELATRLGGASERQNRNNYLRLHSRLLEGLQSDSIKSKYDFVLIDCPPSFNVVPKTAIVASDRILVPAIPDYLSTLGITELRRHVSELVRTFNSYTDQNNTPVSKIDPSIMGVIPTMVRVYANKPISAQANFIDGMRATGLTVFDTFIRRIDTQYGEAPQYGVPVVLGSISGGRRTPAEIEMEELTDEFLEKI